MASLVNGAYQQKNQWTNEKLSPMQCCQPPIFSPDICSKSESNPKCLRKSLHQINPKGAYLQPNPFCDKRRGLVELQLGHVIIGMIPATPSMHENHAFGHKKIVNIV